MSFEDELRDKFSNSDLAHTLGDGSLPAVRDRARQRTMRARMATGVAVVAFGVIGGMTFASSWSGDEAQEVEMFDDGNDGHVDSLLENSGTASPDHVSENDLTYIGSFLTPAVDADREGAQRFDFGGHVSAFDPFGDPDGQDGFAGSLFLTGFPSNAEVAEISIPTPRPFDGDTRDLPIAKFVQPFADITDGRAMSYVGAEAVGGLGEYRIGGLEVVDGPGGRRLHWTSWQYFDQGEHDNPGHGHSSLDLSAPNPEGPWYLGDIEGQQTAGYLFAVPEEFADDALGGRRLVSGFQSIGASNVSMSKGAPFFAFEPLEAADPETRIDSPLTLANYESDRAIPGFSTMAITPGAAWVSTSDGRDAVVTVSNAIDVANIDCTNDTSPLESFGPLVSFYDPAELAAVAAGEAIPSSIAPYRTWDPTEHLIPTCGVQISSISVDAAAGRIFVVQLKADTSQGDFSFLPVVHVFDIS